MNLVTEQLNETTLRIALEGRLDVAGTLAIDQRFTAVAATRDMGVIVDLAQVSFIASIGIRTIVSSAKALAHRGGRMALLAPQAMVRKVLETAGIDQVIPVCDDLGSAQAAVARP